MLQRDFVASHWAEQLASSIQYIVDYERAWEEKLLDLYYAERSSLNWPLREYKDSTRERVCRYGYIYSFPKASSFSEYEKPLPGHLAKVVSVLREHPVIERALSEDTEEQAVGVYTAFSWAHVGIILIVEGLVQHAIRDGAVAAASLLEETIRLGEDRRLEGFHITLFHGLRVEEEFNLPNGMKVTSFEKVQDLIDLDYLKAVLLGDRFVRQSFSSMGAIVGRFEWGPAIMSLSDDADSHLPVFREDFREDANLVVDMLPVVCGTPITKFQSFHSCFDQRIATVLGRGWYFPTLREVEDNLSFFRDQGTPGLNQEGMSKVNEVFSQMKRLSEEFSQGNSIPCLTPQDLLTMYKRFNGYLLKSEPLPGLASFLLTMLEGEFVKNRRKKVAQKYGIEFMVLKEVANLAANRGGGASARKAAGIANVLTKEETHFLQEAARAMILRATGVSVNPSDNYPAIKMSHLAPS